MRILFTGASSFTGYWFATKFAEAGHDVIATFTRENAAAYGDDVRGRRVRRVSAQCESLFGCRVGDERFLDLLDHQRFDLLCYHAADVTNYKSPDFDVGRAVASNTHNLPLALRAFADHGGGAVVLTGSVFEGNEGAGSDGLPHFSPYGLSKAVTASIMSYYCAELGITCGKFVIPNPFGPWEDARFTSYLMQKWSAGELATIRTPAYVRDNIHVSVLALSYVAFANTLLGGNGFRRLNPSGYAESQGQFAERIAQEVRARIPWECRLELLPQSEFSEPRVRVNTEPVTGQIFDWKESRAWDDFVDYYVQCSVSAHRS